MKKFSISLLCCLLLCFGLFTFGGCDNTPTVQNISILTTPTKTNYLIGEQLDLSGGVLSVKYTDGNTSQLPLSVATPDNYTFSTAGDKIITLTFQQKTTTFGVSVAKRDIVVAPNFALPNAYYTGEALPINLRALNTITLGDDSTYTTEYKLSSEPDTQYTTQAPTQAGTYTVRINITGGTSFNDMTIQDKNYTILPTTLPKLSTLPISSGYSLEYNFSKYAGFTYGETIDFSKCWINVDNSGKAYYGTAPIPAQFRDQLKYEYRVKGAETWTLIPSYQGTNIIALDAGEYEIQVSIKNVANVSDYSLILPFVVNQKQLVLGTDYTIQAFNSGAGYNLSSDGSTEIAYNGSAYEVVAHPSEELTGLLQITSIKYLDVNEHINSLAPTNAGKYSAVYTINAGKNYQPITQSVDFTIHKASIDLPTISPATYTFDHNAKKFYVDNLDPKLTYTVEYSPAGNNTYTTDAPTQKGTYDVIIRFQFTDPSYSINYVLPSDQQSTLTIE